MANNESAEPGSDRIPVQARIAHQESGKAAFRFNRCQRHIAPNSVHARRAKDILQVLWICDAGQFGQFADAGMADLYALAQLHGLHQTNESGDHHRKRDRDQRKASEQGHAALYRVAVVNAEGNYPSRMLEVWIGFGGQDMIVPCAIYMEIVPRMPFNFKAQTT